MKSVHAPNECKKSKIIAVILSLFQVSIFMIYFAAYKWDITIFLMTLGGTLTLLIKQC